MILVAALASAGTLNINGVRVDAPPATTMSDVSVRFDADGNIWIDAPQYRVAVIPPAPEPRPPEPVGTITPGTWWLVVADDNSTRQQIDVAVNGTFVLRVKSGDPQHLVDLAPYLRHGRNTVVLQAAPSDGATGNLTVYVGQGSNGAAGLSLGTPAVKYIRQPGIGTAGGAQAFSVDVP